MSDSSPDLFKKKNVLKSLKSSKNKRYRTKQKVINEITHIAEHETKKTNEPLDQPQVYATTSANLYDYFEKINAFYSLNLNGSF